MGRLGHEGMGRGVLDMKEKERIVALIGDLDEKHQGKIYEIIEKHQPTLLSAECDIEVRSLAHRVNWRRFSLLHPG